MDAAISPFEPESLQKTLQLNAGQNSPELVRGDRFAEMEIEPGCAYLVGGLILAPTAQGDERCRLPSGKQTDLPGSLVAVHAWHFDIHEDDIRADLPCCIHCFDPIKCHPDFMAFDFEEHGHRFSRRLQIVDDEDAFPGHQIGQRLRCQ